MKSNRSLCCKCALVTLVTLSPFFGEKTVHGQGAGVILSAFEGKITGIFPARSSKDQTVLEVMGVRIIVPPDVKVTSPTKSGIPVEDMLRHALPGRADRGFLGGTAIVNATTENGITTALDIFMEPSENILMGPITANKNGQLSLLGVSVVLLQDPRIHGAAHNPFGFEISFSGTPVGAPAVAEGYFGNDGVFYAFLIETEGDLIFPGPQTSILRARGTDGARLDVLGGSTSSTGIVTIYDDDTNALLGSAVVTPDVVGSQFGSYIFRLNLGNAQPSPRNIRIENTNGSRVTGEVTIR